MSEAEVEMSPDEQEARSIRYSSLVALALLESGRWAVFTTDQIEKETFRNEVTFHDSLDLAELQARGEAEREQRRREEQEYEERGARLRLGPATVSTATKSLEDMGL